MKDVLGVLNAVQTLLNWLAMRGLERERIIKLLNRAESEDRDLTTAEVQAEIDATTAALDETENLINED